MMQIYNGIIMGYKLCVAEKPSVAKDIAGVIGACNRRDGYFEGNGYLVTWAVGHLVGLAEPHAYGYVHKTKLYSDDRDRAYNELPLFPDVFKLVVLDSTKKQFNIVKELMKRQDVDIIIDCGDMGPEGHLLQWLIREKAGCDKRVMRFCTTSLTDEAIRSAMSNLRDINEFESVIKSQFCKTRADWVLGITMSRAMSLKFFPGIVVGRVLSPTLFFVVQRFLDVKSFVVTDFFGLKVSLAEGFDVFWSKDSADLFERSLKDEHGRVLDKNVIAGAARDVKASGVGAVSVVESVKKKKERPQLYDITELQRDANIKFGYSASVTLATAQALYETYKVLSYPRTDSRFITSDLVRYMEPRVHDIATIGRYKNVADTLLVDGLNIDGRIVDDSKVTDHHAIVATENIKNFDFDGLFAGQQEKAVGVTDSSLRDVLNLVVTRMLVAFAKPYLYEQTNISVSFSNGFVFTAGGSKPVFYGWRAVQATLTNGADISDADDHAQLFPALAEEQIVHVNDCVVLDKKTEPPKLHTEATLLTAMENAGAAIGGDGAVLKGKGIGTQATRADVINRLFGYKLVETSKKGKTNYLVPTMKGLNVITAMPKELRSPKVTADWEYSFSDIVAGKLSDTGFMSSFKVFLSGMVEQVKNNNVMLDLTKEQEVCGACTWCGADVYVYNKPGKTSGLFYFCSVKCGWTLDTHDNTWFLYLGRHINKKEALRFISDGKISLTVKNKSGSGTHKKEFVFSKRESKNKVYCNVVGVPHKTVSSR
jgi:DNA topoisomerase-3